MWAVTDFAGLAKQKLAHRTSPAASHRAALRHPQGMREISRGLSAATPPETDNQIS